VTVYFVDEDVGTTAAFRAQVSRKGYAVEPIQFAEDGEARLLSAVDVELAIIDVMLGQRGGVSRYSLDRTHFGLTTGLRLVDALVEARSDLYPERLALWTHARNTEVVSLAQEHARKYSIPLLRKRNFRTGKEFADRIDGIVKSREQSDDGDAGNG